MTYDTESDYLFGLHVSRTPKCWAVMSGNTVVEEAADYGDAVAKRVAIIESYLPKLDEFSIAGMLHRDRRDNARAEIVSLTGDSPSRDDNVRDLRLSRFYVDTPTGRIEGEAYDDEALAMERLLEAVRSRFVPLVRGADFGDAMAREAVEGVNQVAAE